MNLEPGVRVGPYSILSALGAGGMGEVYHARDERLGRNVALKILSTQLAASADHLRRFEQEARAASALNHPNIITIYDIGKVDSMAYISMELIEGRDLRSMIAGEALPLKQALRIAVKVADGLAAAHERGIVHRDLKPENLMVSRDGFIKILDFGLAKLVRPFTDNDTTMPHTTPGAVFGTVGYMSPEQAAAREVDFRSDQFALGVILYEMLAGRLPFSERTAAETLAAIIRNDPAPLTAYNDKVPAELLRIVTRLLAKEPDDRYASTRDLARDLREVRDRISNSSDPAHVSDAGSVVQRRPRAAIFVAAALTLFVTGVVWMTRDRAAGPPPPPAGGDAQHAIAVVPFRNLSGSPDGQMLTDGVSATVTARLAETSGIRVAALFGGSAIAPDADPREVARKTGADLVLHGGVQRAGEELRVNFTLLEPASGSRIATETLTGTTANLFALQDLVAERVMEKLNLRAESGRRAAPKTDLSTAEEQQTFVEASGLLWRLKDDESLDLALSKLESLLRNARDSAHLNGTLGRAYLVRYRRNRRPADLEQAKLFAERAVQLDADVAAARVTLGEVHSNTGRLADAEKEFRRALEIQPNAPAAVVALADTLALMGRSADAEKQYLEAVKLAPDWQSVFAKIGGFYYNRGDYGNAIRYWQRQADLIPDSPRPYANLGAAYQAQGDYAQALQLYERSLAIQPSSAGYINRGSCEYLLGRYADAVRSFEKAAQLTPDDAVCWLNLGDAQRWAGGKEAAAASFARAIAAAAVASAANPKDPLPHVITGISKAKTGKPAEAKVAIDEALRIDPTHAVALYQAAVIAEIRGDRDAALAWLGRAVAAGYPASDALRDPELRKLRDDPAFQKTISRSKA